MRRMMSLAGLGLACLAVPAAAQDAQNATRIVPSSLIALVKPPAGKADSLHKVIATPSGFLVTFARSSGALPFTLFTQRYSRTGAPVGASIPFDSGTVGDHAVMTKTGPTSAVAAWMATGQLKVAKVNLGTGRVTGARLIGKTDDHIHDIARLANGNIAVVTPQIQALPLPSRYKVSLKILSPSLGQVKAWQSVHGIGFLLDAWAYLDQTVVARPAGGTVIYRDHATNKIMGRNFTNTGVLGSTVQISTTPFAPFAVTDIAYLEVKAAQLSNGKVAVCWVALQATSLDRYDIRCRVLTAAGVPQGPSDILVSTTGAKNQYGPEVVALADGRFTATWVHLDGFSPSIRYRSYNATGAGNPVPLFAERIGTNTTTLAISPMQIEAALLGDGSIATVVSADTFVPGLRAYGIAAPGR